MSGERGQQYLVPPPEERSTALAAVLETKNGAQWWQERQVWADEQVDALLSDQLFVEYLEDVRGMDIAGLREQRSPDVMLVDLELRRGEQFEAFASGEWYPDGDEPILENKIADLACAAAQHIYDKALQTAEDLKHDWRSLSPDLQQKLTAACLAGTLALTMSALHLRGQEPALHVPAQQQEQAEPIPINSVKAHAAPIMKELGLNPQVHMSSKRRANKLIATARNEIIQKVERAAAKTQYPESNKADRVSTKAVVSQVDDLALYTLERAVTSLPEQQQTKVKAMAMRAMIAARLPQRVQRMYGAPRLSTDFEKAAAAHLRTKLFEGTLGYTAEQKEIVSAYLVQAVAESTTPSEQVTAITGSGPLAQEAAVFPATQAAHADPATGEVQSANPKVTLLQILAGDSAVESGEPANPDVTNRFGFHGAWQFGKEFWPYWADKVLGDKNAPWTVDNQVMVAVKLWTTNLENLGSADAAIAAWLKGMSVAHDIAGWNQQAYDAAMQQADGNGTTERMYIEHAEDKIHTLQPFVQLPFLREVMKRNPDFDWSLLDREYHLYAPLHRRELQSEQKLPPPATAAAQQLNTPTSAADQPEQSQTKQVVSAIAAAAGAETSAVGASSEGAASHAPSEVDNNPSLSDLGMHETYVNGEKVTKRLAAIIGLKSTGEESTPGSAYYIEGANGYAIVDASIAPQMAKLVAAAKAEGIELSVASSFRSDEHQAALFRADPNPAEVAPPHYSNHQSGEAIDFDIGSPLVATDYATADGQPPSETNPRVAPNSAVYKWLVAHAAKFGLRQYYNEPWHWSTTGR